MVNSLKAGFARRIISPPKGIYLIGYGDRTWGNKGIHDDLTASALTLDDGRNRIVIVACDLFAINEFTLDKVLNEVKENVMVCCSHTHSGPIVYKHKNASRRSKRYVDYLVRQLIDSINEAVSEMQPATLYWGKSAVDLAINRRERKPGGEIEIGHNPEGVVDQSVGILQVQTKNEKPLANLINLSCHNVVLGPNNLLVSADWAGNMRMRIEKATGTPSLFIQGAAADLNPDHEWGENDFDAVERFGHSAAADVLSGFAGLEPVEAAPILFRELDVWLPLEANAESTKPPKTYRKILSKTAGLPDLLVDTILNIRYPWKTRIEAREGSWAIPLRLSVLMLGDVTWVGLGAEVFTEIGLRIKELSGSPYAFFSSLTNGCIGYLPTEKEYPLGGYEVDLAPYFYRLPGRLQADSEQKVLTFSRDTFENLRAERKNDPGLN